MRGRHVIHHPVPPPPPSWHALNAAARRHSPAAAFASCLADAVAVPAAPSKQGLLTPRNRGRPFADPALARYVACLFVATALRHVTSSLPRTTLSPFDLFHAHVVHTASAGFALLLHAAEYPALDDRFPHHLGHGQVGSPLAATPHTTAFRNIIAAGGRLATVDVSPTSPVADALLWPELADVGTVCEQDVGAWVGDVTYLVQAGVRGGGRVLAFEGPGQSV